MTQDATTATVTEAPRPSLMQNLYPSVVSGILVGVVGAVVVALVVNAVTQGSNQDATLAAAYTAWVFFFLVGIGAFNDVLKWGFARREPTHEEEQQLAGKGQGLWRYFRWTTDHKVVGMQYLATTLLLFFVGSLGAFSIRLEQSMPGAIFFTPSTYNTIVGMHGIIMIVAAVIMVAGPFGNYVVPIKIGARDKPFPASMRSPTGCCSPTFPSSLRHSFLVASRPDGRVTHRFRLHS
jgi:cytochrome c oxidase subunit I